MKHFLSSIFLILLFSISKIEAQAFFEGELSYKIEYEIINKNIPKGMLEKQMGDSFKAFVKEDKYIMLLNTTGEFGWTKTTVRLDEGYSYIEYEKLDTIYKFKHDINKSELLKISRSSNDRKKILNEECEYVTLNYRSTNPNSAFGIIKGKHYFSPKYKLNADKYKNYKSDFWNLYVKESGAISIRNEHFYEGIFKSVSEVTQILEKDISDELFLLDKNKFVKLEK